MVGAGSGGKAHNDLPALSGVFKRIGRLKYRIETDLIGGYDVGFESKSTMSAVKIGEASDDGCYGCFASL